MYILIENRIIEPSDNYAVFRDSVIDLTTKKLYNIKHQSEYIWDLIAYTDMVVTKDSFGIYHSHLMLQDPYDKFNLSRWIKTHKNYIVEIYKKVGDNYVNVYKKISTSTDSTTTSL